MVPIYHATRRHIPGDSNLDNSAKNGFTLNFGVNVMTDISIQHAADITKIIPVTR
jgi:hypothetical protein